MTGRTAWGRAASWSSWHSAANDSGSISKQQTSSRREMREVRTVLYKAYAADGTPLYFGITGDWAKRWCQHKLTRPEYFAVARLEMRWFPSRASARRAETQAIECEQPKWNWIRHRREGRANAETAGPSSSSDARRNGRAD